MRLTDQSQRVVMMASDAAHTLGAEQVGPLHLLLGLAEVEGGARHMLGLDAEALRTAGAALFPPRPPHPDSVRVGFAAELKAAIEDSTRHARAGGRDFVATTDLLAALLDAQEGPAAEVLVAAGGDPAALRAALAAQEDHNACCQETAISIVRPVLAELSAGAGSVPRHAWLASLSAALLLSSLLYAVLLSITWDTAGPELVLTMAGGLIAMALLVGPLLGRVKVRRLTASSLTVVPLPEDAGPLLDRLGVRRLEVHVQPGFGTDHCYRLGRRALVFLSSHTERDPERARFVLWHEIAHLARRDSLVGPVTWLLGLGALFGALTSFDLRAMLFAGVAVPTLSVAGRWWGEAACDRFAVRQAGAGALHAWATTFRAISTGARHSNAVPRRAAMRSWLTHPPLALRMALHPIEPLRSPVGG